MAARETVRIRNENNRVTSVTFRQGARLTLLTENECDNCHASRMTISTGGPERAD